MLGPVLSVFHGLFHVILKQPYEVGSELRYSLVNLLRGTQLVGSAGFEPRQSDTRVP